MGRAFHRGAALALGALAAACAMAALFAADAHRVSAGASSVWVRRVRHGDGRPLRVLASGGVYQSAMYDDGAPGAWCELPFAYYRGFDRLFDAENPSQPKPLTVGSLLLIGGGGCCYPKHLLTARRKVAVDVLEPDPAVRLAARRWFCVDRLERTLRASGQSDRFRLLGEEGAAYLVRRPKTYDAIINDAFDGADPAGSLAGSRGALLAAGCLAPGGLYLVNLVLPETAEGGAQLIGAMAEIGEVFSRVWALDSSDEIMGGQKNYLIIASQRSYCFSGALDLDDILAPPDPSQGASLG